MFGEFVLLVERVIMCLVFCVVVVFSVLTADVLDKDVAAAIVVLILVFHQTGVFNWSFGFLMFKRTLGRRHMTVVMR